MRITEVSRRLGNNPYYAAYFIGKILENSAALRSLQFVPMATKDTFIPSVGTGNTQERAVGGSYTLGDPEYTPIATALKIFGDGFKLDPSIVADIESGRQTFDEWFKGQLDDRALDFAEDAEIKLWTGAGTSNAIKGLKTILNGTDDIPGMTGVTGVLEAHDLVGVANVLDLTDSANWDKFLEMIEKVSGNVRGGKKKIYGNKEFGAKVSTIARTKHAYQLGIDAFGKPVPMINGIEIHVLADGAIANTEPDDASTPVNDTTSFYLMSDDTSRIAVGTNSGIEFSAINPNDANQSQCTYEFRGVWVPKRKDGIIRVRKIQVV